MKGTGGLLGSVGGIWEGKETRGVWFMSVGFGTTRFAGADHLCEGGP